MAGLSLIEMMIALVMALIVAAGIITVFASTSSSNKVQAQMAVLQEEGRFAIQSLRADLANANGGYCSNSGGNAGGTTSGLFLDSLRSPIIYAKTLSTVNAAFYDNTTSITGDSPTGAYSLPSFLYMRGYDCTAAACTPVDPHTDVPGIPAMGKAVGDRVPGAAVLTIRYLKPDSGWAISPNGTTPGSTITPASGSSAGSVDSITLSPLTGEDPASDFTGTLAMLADCSNAQVFQVAVSGNTITPDTTAGANYAQPLDISKGAAPRIFDFSNDFQTVTYFLEVVDAGNGHTTGELVRRVNGVDQPMVRGVERLDFSYGIINASGNAQFLTAAQVDTATDCPPDVSMPAGMPTTGCLWRAVQTIQVNILMDGQTPLYTLTPAETYYIYSPDGGATPTAPSAHAIQPDTDQGFPKQLLRREFTTLVALRNFNP
jgi:type IV pilus assembly protein PilW